jgi:glycosyltransferase involved in cell wall biosynthesis
MPPSPPAEARSSPTVQRLPVGVLVLARDEEVNLPDCLHSVTGWASQVVVVVDPRTTDRTREIALACGAEVCEHPFEDYARQKNWALDHAGLSTPWILIVDADERVSPELREEIGWAVAAESAKVAYAMRFRFIFYGKWIRHCWHSTWIIRFFRAGKAKYEIRGVHEHMVVDGELGYFGSDLIHNDFKGMDDWIVKHNRYASSEAEAMSSPERGGDLRGRLLGSPLERRRFLKERIWNRLPLRPLWLFIYLYFLKLGFLDGMLGLRFCVMHAVFDTFTMAKVWESKRLANGAPPNYYRKELDGYLARHPEARSYYE